MLLPVRRHLLHVAGVLVSASGGTEVHQLASRTQRNGKRLIHMHTAHGITD